MPPLTHNISEQQTRVSGWAPDQNHDNNNQQTQRFSPELSGVSGYREIFSLDEGLQLVKSDVNFDRDTEFAVSLDSLLKFQFRLEGKGSLHFDGHKDIPMHEFSGGMLLHPEGLEKIECFKRGEHERAITLLVSPDYLLKRFPIYDQVLPSPLTFYLDAGIDDVFFSRLPLTPEIASAAQGLYSPGVKSEFATLYRQSRAQELLVYCLQLLSQTPSRAHVNLKSNDIECINEARRIIESDIAAAPKIRDLALRVGINESKLMSGFKELYNQTLHDYLRSCRMNKAKELLLSTDAPITQIALDVGYEFSSNFTIAFKRHFGQPPSAVRKQR